MPKSPSVGTPTTYAPPAPPTAANAAAVQASADARQKALEKQGINSTLLASAGQQQQGTGDMFKATPPGENTLLGGG